MALEGAAHALLRAEAGAARRRRPPDAPNRSADAARHRGGRARHSAPGSRRSPPRRRGRNCARSSSRAPRGFRHRGFRRHARESIGAATRVSFRENSSGARWALNCDWPPGRIRYITWRRATVSAMASPKSSRTRASARSMPAVTPAEVQILPVAHEQRVALQRHIGKLFREQIHRAPMGGGALALEQTDGGEEERARTDRDDTAGAPGAHAQAPRAAPDRARRFRSRRRRSSACRSSRADRPRRHRPRAACRWRLRTAPPSRARIVSA